MYSIVVVVEVVGVISEDVDEWEDSSQTLVVDRVSNNQSSPSLSHFELREVSCRRLS
jgi:hypothetical protein